METSRGTLTRCPDSALAKRFAVTDPEAMDTVSMLNDNGDGIFLVHNIDCDPSCFQMILSWLRFGVVPKLPEDVDHRILVEAAKQFGLEDLEQELTTQSEADNPHPLEKGAMTDWLRLNVGGTIFETSRTTLTSDPDSILSRMFEPNSNLPPATVTKGGAYLIDACPRGFEVVLNYLRYRSLVLGPDTKATDVLPVADYFGLQELRVLLERHQEKEAEERLKMTSCIEESVEKLEAVLQCVECEVSALNEKLEDLKIEMSSIATGVEDLWRIKCELANISQVLSNGVERVK